MIGNVFGIVKGGPYHRFQKITHILFLEFSYHYTNEGTLLYLSIFEILNEILKPKIPL
jgi:hypothetical protein